MTLARRRQAELCGKEACKTVVASLQDYQKFLEDDLLPQADGEWRVGPEKFAQKLELELQTGRSAAEVMQDAETEFARVRSDMYVLSRQLWSNYYPKQPLPPDDDAGRRARSNSRKSYAALANDHGTADQLATNMIERVARLKQLYY